ncbi:hypothetical protein, partial [Streptococcus salivarius]|uniref:hypothetical protein n=1 Tax=Streptococcus salivarius TaxID=1304 RepID=UPI001C2DF62E
NSSISDEHVFCVALHFTIGLKKKVRLSKKSLFLLKMDFLWVDFAYMAFYKISFGKIFSKLYCYFVFFLKRFILKLRNGI